MLWGKFWILDSGGGFGGRDIYFYEKSATALENMIRCRFYVDGGSIEVP
jgi:hypothetical protein